MTSSYNLTRRKNILEPINWGAFQKHIGTCPPGYLTVPVAPSGNCSDWKFCVPLNNKDGSTVQYPVYDKQTDEPFVETRHFANHIYPNPKPTDQSLQNFYPIEKRRYDTRRLIKEDYFRLPIAFNGTGYDYKRSWSYPQEYATDTVVLPDEWSPFELIQRRAMQKQTIRELGEREKLGFKPYTAPYLGEFYREV